MPQKEAPIWASWGTTVNFLAAELFPLLYIENDLGFLGASFCNLIDILISLIFRFIHTNFSHNFMVLFFKGIMKVMDEEDKLKQIMLTQIQKPHLKCRELATCFIGTFLDCFDPKSMETIDDDLVVNLSKKFKIQSLGILLLEKKPKGHQDGLEPAGKRRKAALIKKQFEDETVLAL